MTSTEQAATTAPADPEREIFGKGDPSGVCHFVTGPGQICGNVVYANKEKGRLPLYCGQEGQAEWQQQYGTEGNSEHKSELATYYRKRAGMEKEEVAALAAAETAQRGIIRRHKASAPSAAPAETPAAPAGPVTIDDLVNALAESPIDALTQLTQLFVGRVSAARAEMDAVHAKADQRVAEIEQQAVQSAEELAAERESLEVERAEVQALREQVEGERAAANEARLRAEGERDGAQRRIAELEQQIADSERRHRAEIAEVREREEARYDRLVAAFAATRTDTETAPTKGEPADERPVTAESVQTMAKRVARNEVTRSGPVWKIANAVAPRPAAAVLNRMQSDGYLLIGSQGEPERVTLTEAYQGPRR